MKGDAIGSAVNWIFGLLIGAIIVGVVLKLLFYVVRLGWSLV